MSLSMTEARFTGLSTDPKPTNDISPGAVYLETDTHDTYYWHGDVWKTWRQIYKDGRYMGVISISSANGLLQGAISSVGSFTRFFDSTYGQHQQIATAATTGSFAGIRSIRFTERTLNPHIRFVFALDTITDINMFIGLTSYTAAVTRDTVAGTVDDFYPDNNSIGMIFRDGQTDFELYTNGNSPPGTNHGSITTADIDTIHTLEIRARRDDDKFQYKLDNASSWTDVVTDIPIETQDVGFQAWIETRADEVKTWRLIDVDVRHDNRG